MSHRLPTPTSRRPGARGLVAALCLLTCSAVVFGGCDDTATGDGSDASLGGRPSNIRDAAPSIGGTEFPPVGGQGGNGEGGNGQGGNGQGGDGGNGQGGNGQGGDGGNGQGGNGGNGQGGNGQGGDGGNGQGGDGGNGQGGEQPGDPCDDVVCGLGEVCNPDTGRCESNVVDPCEEVACGLDEHCEEGICVPDDVPDPDDGIAHGCAGPEECPEGFCIDEATSEGAYPGGFCVVECVGDADCAGGLCAQVDVDLAICIATCGRPEDCREGWACYADAEAPSSYCIPDCRVTGCGGAGTCNEMTGVCGDPVVGCQSDLDCLPGEQCDAISGRCIAGAGCETDNDCAFDEFCNQRTGTCEPADVGCQDDADCAAGEVCNPRTSVCEPAVDCRRDADCGLGEVCNAGVCAADPNLCIDDADCARGELCDFATGQCIPEGGFCEFDADCAADEICNPRLGVCQPVDPGAAGRYEACDEVTPCDVDLICVTIGEQGNFCLGICDSTAAIDGCLPREGCFPFDPALPQEAVCIPGNECGAGNATEICGADASCTALGHGTFCVNPGDAGVGEPCDPIYGDTSCQADLMCDLGVCRAACDAAGACASGECFDRTDDFDGVEVAYCVATCDFYAQAGCGAGEFCAISAIGEGGAVIGECAAGEGGAGERGEACVSDEMTYWGDCSAAHLCDALFEGDAPSCLAFCDPVDASLCDGASACWTGLFDAPLESLGLCVGECDTFTGAGCGAGETCTFTGRVGPSADAIEAPIAFCLPGNGSADVGEACTPDAQNGGSDCAVGSVCIDALGDGATVCVAVCEDAPGSPNTCAAGETCVTGLGADELGFGGSEVIGLCLAL
ncbi:hypothetical protein L6V77_06715 [Myxococcota bacterium]|nr:hypothetical protein [Myxococcota bacterium]